MRKRYKITNLYSSDLDCNKVSLYHPQDPSDVYFQFYFDVEDCNTGEFTEFQGVVCTPVGLVRDGENHSQNLLEDRASLIYKVYSYDDLIADLDRILSLYALGEDLEEVAKGMQRYFLWEYENVSSSE